MKTIEVAFAIGDEVAVKSIVRSWASGSTPSVSKRKVIGINLSNWAIYHVEGAGTHNEENLIPYSEVKSYALQWLTERLSVVAKGVV